MIEELIDKLGISRRMLSTLLDTTQSHLSRYENHTRNLPLAAIPQVAQLVALLHTAPAIAAPRPTPAGQEEAMAQARWCRVQMVPLQKKLATMQKEYERANTMLYVLDAYIKKGLNPDAKIQSWIEGQTYAANRKIESNGWLPQQQMAWKITVLQQEAQFWETASSAVQI